MANDSSGDELTRRLQDISALSLYVPRGILDVKTRVAERLTAMYAPAG